MRILASAIALAVALAWPNVGEAQSKKSTARSTATVQQKQVKRQKTARVRTAAQARRGANAMRRLSLVGMRRLGSRSAHSLHAGAGLHGYSVSSSQTRYP